MTTEPAELVRRSTVRSVVISPLLLWGAFLVVHVWLEYLNLYGKGLQLGDVSIVYKFWTDQAVVSHYLVGIDGSWVYPILALVPMLLARAFGPELYSSTWLSLVMVLDVVAFGVLTGWGRRRNHTLAGWWWILFLVLLGPIALGRIDAVSVPIALVGVLYIATRPQLAASLLTIATWIKVWPAAIIIAMVVMVKDRFRIVAAAATTSLIIIGVALALGSGPNVFSFISQQSSRGLQVEAPVTTFWLWAALAHFPNTFLYYDHDFLTWQVRGPGVETTSALMTPLLGLVMLAITIIAFLALRRGISMDRLLAPLGLAYVVALIAVNKVGSPQYIAWLAVPVILGLVGSASGRGVSFRTPAALSAIIAALTQVIYPYLYEYLLGLDLWMLVVISLRNLALFVLLAWALVALWRDSSAVPVIRHSPEAEHQRSVTVRAVR